MVVVYVEWRGSARCHDLMHDKIGIDIEHDLDSIQRILTKKLDPCLKGRVTLLKYANHLFRIHG